MTTEDELDFLDFVKTTGNVKILPLYSTQDDLAPIDILPEPFSKKNWVQFLLFNQSISENLKVDFFPKPGHYAVDEITSSVIQFSRSSIRDGVVRRGRIWATFSYPNQARGKMLSKEPTFKQWYETIDRWIKKRYLRLDRLIYAGPGAQKFVSDGGSYDLKQVH
jgi:hypothetical protein